MAAILAALGSVLVWVVSQAVDLDTRIDHLESVSERVIDPSTGAIRPSSTALRNELQVESLTAEMGRAWERIFEIENRFIELAGHQHN